MTLEKGIVLAIAKAIAFAFEARNFDCRGSAYCQVIVFVVTVVVSAANLCFWHRSRD
jgi:hypothetical protein